MRSKTTVGGPSLSACLVIALGGERGGGGNGGRGLWRHWRLASALCGAALAPGLLTPALPRHSQSKY